MPSTILCMDENEISRKVIGAAMRVHRRLGPGLLESVYEGALAYELSKDGFSVLRQVPIRLQYDELTWDTSFRCDLLVEDRVIIEVKAVEEVQPVHHSQLLTYLRFANKRLGLLVNFNRKLLKDGITRIDNGLAEHTDTESTLMS